MSSTNQSIQTVLKVTNNAMSRSAILPPKSLEICFLGGRHLVVSFWGWSMFGRVGRLGLFLNGVEWVKVRVGIFHLMSCF